MPAGIGGGSWSTLLAPGAGAGDSAAESAATAMLVFALPGGAATDEIDAMDRLFLILVICDC